MQVGKSKSGGQENFAFILARFLGPEKFSKEHNHKQGSFNICQNPVSHSFFLLFSRLGLNLIASDNQSRDDNSSRQPHLIRGIFLFRGSRALGLPVKLRIRHPNICTWTRYPRKTNVQKKKNGKTSTVDRVEFIWSWPSSLCVVAVWHIWADAATKDLGPGRFDSGTSIILPEKEEKDRIKEFAPTPLLPQKKIFLPSSPLEPKMGRCIKAYQGYYIRIKYAADFLREFPHASYVLQFCKTFLVLLLSGSTSSGSKSSSFGEIPCFIVCMKRDYMSCQVKAFFVPCNTKC